MVSVQHACPGTVFQKVNALYAKSQLFRPEDLPLVNHATLTASLVVQAQASAFNVPRTNSLKGQAVFPALRVSTPMAVSLATTVV